MTDKMSQHAKNVLATLIVSIIILGAIGYVVPKGGVSHEGYNINIQIAPFNTTASVHKAHAVTDSTHNETSTNSTVVNATKFSGTI